MSKLYSLEDYFAYLKDHTDFELGKLSAFPEFDEWVESVNPAMMHDEAKFDVWFDVLEEHDFVAFAESMWKRSRLDDDITQAQENAIIEEMDSAYGEMLYDMRKELEKEMDYARI